MILAIIGLYLCCGLALTVYAWRDTDFQTELRAERARTENVWLFNFIILAGAALFGLLWPITVFSYVHALVEGNKS